MASIDQLRSRSRWLLNYTLLTAAISFAFTKADAQTFAEWFSQKSTKKKYLLQQIAALEAYGSVLKTGYNVAHKGLGTIGSFNNGEFQLHSTFYTNLKAVSPAVQHNAQAKEILAWQQDINTAFSHVRADDYYNEVKAAVLKDCDQQLTELQKVLAGNSMEMSDADRLKRIGAIHAEMLSNYRFTIGFCNNATLMDADKNRQPADLQTLKNLYGNH
jgi:hypothetical protein